MENWESKNTRKEPGSVCDQKIHAYFAHAYAQHSTGSVRRLMVQRLMNHGKRWCCQAVGQISSRFSALLSPAILTSLGGQKNSTLWSIPFRLIFVGLTQKRVRIFVSYLFSMESIVFWKARRRRNFWGYFSVLRSWYVIFRYVINSYLSLSWPKVSAEHNIT